MKIKQMLMGVLALGCACAFGENTKDGESSGVAVQKLQTCDFLLNKDFKKDAKYYLCLFSASWCPPCRAEMPRIAKTYAETLKDDPNIELIHFSCDQNDEKALAWAKEHDVKFPVVKPNGGNPLDLHTRGIPHLFIVKADGTLIEEGHPMKLFTDEKLREYKSERGVSEMTYTDNGGCTWSYTDNNNEGSLTITGVRLQTPSPVTIPTSLNGKNVTRIGDDAFRDNAMIIGVTIPGCIVGIGDRAFAGCANLEELTILEGVKAIGGSDAFRWCPKLKTVTLPKSLTFIRQRVFRNGGGIENVNVDSVESYMSIGFGTGSSTPLYSGKACLCVNGERLVDLIVPVGCRRITASAFNGANGLRSITIPGSVSQIGCCAFDNCSSNVVIRFANDIGALTLERNVAGGAGCPTIEVLSKSGCPFLGWFDKDGNEVKDPFHSPTPIVVTPRWNGIRKRHLR